jgi:hypothetical protein
MRKIKYSIDYDSIYKPIIGLILVLSSVKLGTYISILKKDGIFNYLLILHIILIILSALFISFPYLFKYSNIKKNKIFRNLGNKCNGKIVRVHHKEFGGRHFTNLEISYYSKIFKKNMSFFSKQVKYNLVDLEEKPKCIVYEVEEDKLPFEIGSSVLTRYSFISQKKKKVVVFADMLEYDLRPWDKYFSYIVFGGIILIEIIIGIYV